jgi:transposase
MPKTYSSDLRERVVAAVMAGGTCRGVAARFEISVSSVVKWSQRFRQTGIAAAKPRGGRPGLMLAGEREWIIGRLRTKADLTLRALVDELEARGIRASYGAVWRVVHAAGYSFKKRRFSPASRIVPTSRAAARAGVATKPSSTHRALSSSTRHGPRRT